MYIIFRKNGVKCSSKGNLRDKKETFTSRQQLTNGESIFCSCFSLYIMIDTRVDSDLAKTKIVTFALKVINNKSVSKTPFTQEEFIRVNVEPDKNLSVFACCV